MDIANWPVQDNEMGRSNLRIDIRLQVYSGRASIFVGENLCASRNLGLPADARSPFDSTRIKSFPKRRQKLRILTQFQSEYIGDHVTSDVVRGWAQPASHKQNFSARK